MKNSLIFPKNFFWGAATAAHQVEGNNHNDWTEWEQSESRIRNLESCGLTKKYGLGNYISGKACDHYNRYKEDFNLAKKLGHNTHRFSIEWSRIEPEEGKFDQKEIDHYKSVVEYLRKLNIEPFVTLWHWPIPLWLRDKGGWKNREVVNYFARYTEKVVSALKNDVKFWITLNEPEIYTGNSYLTGTWPPQERNVISYFSVIQNQINAHKLAYDVIKSVRPKAIVGFSKHYVYFEPYQNKLVNRFVKKPIDWWYNFYFLNSVKNHMDFIGLNHYLFYHLNPIPCHIGKFPVSDFGWKLKPDTIYFVLKELQAKYDKPIYITENGIADSKDKYRPWFITEVFKNIHKAISEGIDVRGYLHWSLTDNFEWDSGFWPRFGLVEIDNKTLKRIPRPSAIIYRDICRANKII